MAENIIFKGRGSGLNVILSSDCDFDTLKAEFKAKAAQNKKFFGRAKAVVTFSGRELTSNEESELIKILIDETGVAVREKSKAKAKEPDKAKRREDVIAEIYDRHDAGADSAFFHTGSLRSGQAINYKGSVVVVGDVNPGGEIIAEGNIIVLGAVKGMVHAGCGGDAGRFVFALKFIPTQLRIADIIAYIPPEFNKKGKDGASYAYVENKQIFIKQM